MGNISHLIGGGGQVSDSVEADRVNSIVERIAGVNPSKLAAKVTGAEVQTFGPGGMGGGSMPRALQVAQQQMAPQPQGYLPGQYVPSQFAPEPQRQASPAPHPQMQAIMERMAMLEQKVAFYEQEKNDDEKKFRGPSNRGPESRVWGRDIDPKKAKEKDDVDGKPDSQQPAATKEHMMSNDVREAIGMDLNEWKKLAGLADPYGAEPSVNLTDGDRQHLYEDIYEDAPAVPEPPKPAAPKPDAGPKPGVARKVAKTMGTMMKSLGKGATRVGKAALSASVEQEFRAEMWEAFLHDRGLSVDVFGQLVDEALASDDAEEMDALLAVEEVFERLLHQALEHYDDDPVEEEFTYGIQEWVAFLEANGMDPSEFDHTVRLAEELGREDILEACKSVVQIFEVDVSMRLKHGGKQITRKDMDKTQAAASLAQAKKEIGNFRSVATKEKAVVARAAKKKAAAGGGGGGEDPRSWFTKGKDQELRTSMEDSEMQFEVDADEGGDPDSKQIPWSKIVKAYTSKEERGFGGMSRSGQ